MSLSLAEQETILRHDRASDMASIYTHDKGLIAMLERRGFRADQEYRNGGRIIAKHFAIPKTWISVRPPRKASPAMRAALTKARARQAEASTPPVSPMRSEPRAPADVSDPNPSPRTKDTSKARRSSS